MRAIKRETGGRDLIGGYSDDGYSFMANAAKGSAPWRAVSSWGRDGWDLGDWPYVVYMFREVTAKIGKGDAAVHQFVYQRCCYVEGDVTIDTYATADARSDDTDEAALFYWVGNGESWVEGLTRETTAEQMPSHLRGPYSSSRVAGT